MIVFIYNRQFKNKVRLSKILTRFLGIGRTRSSFLAAITGLTFRANASHLNWFKTEMLGYYLRVMYPLDAKLIKTITFALYRIYVSGSLKSLKIDHGMPCRGQRTHSNAKTSRFFRIQHTVTSLNI